MKQQQFNSLKQGSPTFSSVGRIGFGKCRCRAGYKECGLKISKYYGVLFFKKLVDAK
jgi:hypothetical protein